MPTTAVCDCADAIGWNAEGSLTGACATSAQQIYCLGGGPVVKPYPQFHTYGDTARHDSGGFIAPALIGQAGTIVTPLEFNSASRIKTPLTITNGGCWPVNLTAGASGYVDMNLDAGAAIGTSLWLEVSGSIAIPYPGILDSRQTSGNAGGTFRSDHSFNYNLGTLAPGGSISIQPFIGYYFPGVGGAWNFTSINQWSATVRVWGGDVPS